MPRFEFPDDLLDRYEPVRVLGTGAMGAVFLARDLRLGRRVAIKFMTLSAPGEDRARFDREARALASLASPHVMRIYSHDVEAPTPYLVSEFLEGSPIDKAEGVPVLEAMLEVASGLQELHELGMIHRDVKPANILYLSTGRVVLIDLGLVRVEQETTLTRTGLVVGTPAYMAPEYLLEGRAQPASDWYSWGATLFELLEGRPALARERLADYLGGEAMPPPEFRRVAPDSPGACLARACLDPDPGRRPAGYDALRARLEGGRAGSLRAEGAPGILGERGPGAPRTAGSPGRRVQVVLALGLAGTAAAIGVLGARRGRPSPPPPEAVGPSAPIAVGLSPFAEDLVARVDRQLASLLNERVDAFGAPSGDPAAAPFLDAYLAHGASVLRGLSELQRVHRWIADGGAPEVLSPGAREQLRRVDQMLVDLGIAPPFRPFLDAPGDASQLDEADLALLRRRLPRRGGPAQDLFTTARDDAWLAGTLVSAAEVERAFDRLEREHGPEAPRRLHGQRILAAQDGAVDRFLRPGLRHYRDGVYRLLRVLEASPGRDAGLAGLLDFFASGRRAFLWGSFASATPEQLFGMRPRSRWGKYLVALVVGELRSDISLFPSPPALVSREQVQVFEDALEVVEGEAERHWARGLFPRLMRRLYRQKRYRRLLDHHARHFSMLEAKLDQDDRDFLEEAVRASRRALSGGASEQP